MIKWINESAQNGFSCACFSSAVKDVEPGGVDFHSFLPLWLKNRETAKKERRSTGVRFGAFSEVLHFVGGVLDTDYC